MTILILPLNAEMKNMNIYEYIVNSCNWLFVAVKCKHVITLCVNPLSKLQVWKPASLKDTGSDSSSQISLKEIKNCSLKTDFAHTDTCTGPTGDPLQKLNEPHLVETSGSLS